MEKWINQNTDNGFKLIYRLCFIKEFYTFPKIPGLEPFLPDAVLCHTKEIFQINHYS